MAKFRIETQKEMIEYKNSDLNALKALLHEALIKDSTRIDVKVPVTIRVIIGLDAGLAFGAELAIYGRGLFRPRGIPGIHRSFETVDEQFSQNAAALRILMHG